MSRTIAPVLGEATIQELREAVRGEVVRPATTATARPAGSGTGPRRAPARGDRPLHRRRRRDRGASASRAATT